MIGQTWVPQQSLPDLQWIIPGVWYVRYRTNFIFRTCCVEYLCHLSQKNKRPVWKLIVPRFSSGISNAHKYLPTCSYVYSFPGYKSTTASNSTLPTTTFSHQQLLTAWYSLVIVCQWYGNWSWRVRKPFTLLLGYMTAYPVCFQPDLNLSLWYALCTEALQRLFRCATESSLLQTSIFHCSSARYRDLSTFLTHPSFPARSSFQLININNVEVFCRGYVHVILQSFLSCSIFYYIHTGSFLIRTGAFQSSQMRLHLQPETSFACIGFCLPRFDVFLTSWLNGRLLSMKTGMIEHKNWFCLQARSFETQRKCRIYLFALLWVANAKSIEERTSVPVAFSYVEGGTFLVILDEFVSGLNHDVTLLLWRNVKTEVIKASDSQSPHLRFVSVEADNQRKELFEFDHHHINSDVSCVGRSGVGSQYIGRKDIVDKL